MQLENMHLVLTQDEELRFRSFFKSVDWELLKDLFALSEVCVVQELKTFSGATLSQFEAGRQLGMLQEQCHWFWKVTNEVQVAIEEEQPDPDVDPDETDLHDMLALNDEDSEPIP